MNFNYFISETVFTYIVEAVRLIAQHGWSLLPQYYFDTASGRWHHRNGPVEPPLRLTQLAYDTSGALTYPTQHDMADESQLAESLAWAHTYLHGLGDEELVPAHVSENFEQLRWFELPAVCVSESGS